MFGLYTELDFFKWVKKQHWSVSKNKTWKNYSKHFKGVIFEFKKIFLTNWQGKLFPLIPSELGMILTSPILEQ
jgi:hypothetical protein